ncbi:hypothetical protein B0H14DRAFT_2622002 [Mycena olivaceomarginata]|nr:hypothetical protein B0H14DRAFT_2622002 [Mycena olivaceomarginata]
MSVPGYGAFKFCRKAGSGQPSALPQLKMPELPSELEHEIFTIAFWSSGRDVALKLTLCLVARHVQFWIKCLFYEVVSILGDHCANRFLSLVNLKPPGFFTVVKCLCITYSVKVATAYSILAACTAVESLACWVDSDGSLRAPPPHQSVATALALH